MSDCDVRWMWLVLPMCAGALYVSGSTDVEACSVIGNDSFGGNGFWTNPEEVEADDQPPGPVKAYRVEYSGQEESDWWLSGCEGGGGGSCGANVSILIGEAEDDRTPRSSMGYLITLESGSLPEDRRLPDHPIRTSIASEGRLLLWYGSGKDLRSSDAVLGVAAVDLGGNVGRTSTIALGDDEASCSVAGASTGAPLITLLLSILLVSPLRRR